MNKQFYYMEQPPREVLEFLVDDTDDTIITAQDDIPEDKEILMSLISNLCLQGKFCIYVHTDLIIVLTRKTKFVGIIDTKVSRTATVRGLIRGYKAFVEWAKNNTYYYKIESRTPLERYATVLAKSCGWNMEGTCKKSFMTKEGKLVDEFLVGISLKETE